MQEVITSHEETGFTSCPEYIGAVSVFYKRHLCRLEPWPAGLERTFAGNEPSRVRDDERAQRVHRHGTVP